MNYIGSKLSLLPYIQAILDKHNVPADGIALDLFAGTAVVAQLLKARGHTIYTNDWQHYSYTRCVAVIEHDDTPTFSNLLNSAYWHNHISASSTSSALIGHSAQLSLPVHTQRAAAQVIFYLNSLPGKRGEFYEAYCDGGDDYRMYFSRDNGMRIQAIRAEIEFWDNEKLVTKKEKAWLIACLIEAADRVANTASVYGAHLKHIKASAKKPLELPIIQPVPSRNLPTDNHAFCMDSEELLRELRGVQKRIVYIDPPYNHRQYSSNYHLLETLARWDMGEFTPRGVTGLRNSAESRSAYCLKSTAESAFERLISLSNADYILFSYNNEGIVPIERLSALFEGYCSKVIAEEIDYKRFRADNDGYNRTYRSDSTKEYLILGKLKGQTLSTPCKGLPFNTRQTAPL